MADLQKKNGQKKGVESLSVLDKKRQDLLGGLSELMEQTGGVYGPFLMEQLQRRLEFVVQNFNEEVQALFSESFERWQIKDTQIRDLIDGSMQIPQSQSAKRKTKDLSTPEFIKGVKFGPIRPQ